MRENHGKGIYAQLVLVLMAAIVDDDDFSSKKTFLTLDLTVHALSPL